MWHAFGDEPDPNVAESQLCGLLNYVNHADVEVVKRAGSQLVTSVDCP